MLRLRSGEVIVIGSRHKLLELFPAEVASWLEKTVPERDDGLFERHNVRDHRCSGALPARQLYDVL